MAIASYDGKILASMGYMNVCVWATFISDATIWTEMNWKDQQTFQSYFP